MTYSVIIPCYNAEKYLEETIKSILNQTVSPNEIILINDCSTDRSVEIAEQYKELSIFHNSKNMGIGFTRQAGLEKASSDFVGFLSADDVYHKKFIEKTLPQCKNDTGVYTDYYRTDSQLRPYELVRSLDFSVESVIDRAIKKDMYINFSTVIFPKDINVEFVRELRYGEDLIFLLDTLIYNQNESPYKWQRIREPLLYYRMHRAQGTPFYLRKKSQLELIWKYLKDRLVKLGIDGKLVEMEYRNFMNQAFNIGTNTIISKLKRLIGKLSS
ncbi:MAG: glycosyltransferase family 2 protein [Candidatus Helarchaeota archaeon]